MRASRCLNSNLFLTIRAFLRSRCRSFFFLLTGNLIDCLNDQEDHQCNQQKSTAFLRIYKQLQTGNVFTYIPSLTNLSCNCKNRLVFTNRISQTVSRTIIQNAVQKSFTKKHLQNNSKNNCNYSEPHS